MIFYSATIFQKISNGNETLPKIFSILMGFLLMISPLLAGGFLIDRFGRRTILIFG